VDYTEIRALYRHISLAFPVYYLVWPKGSLGPHVGHKNIADMSPDCEMFICMGSRLVVAVAPGNSINPGEIDRSCHSSHLEL